MQKNNFMFKNINNFNKLSNNFDNSKYAFISNDLTFLKVSKSFAHCFGLIPEECSGRYILELMPFLSDRGINGDVLKNILKKDFFCFEDMFFHPFEKEEKIRISLCKIDSSFFMRVCTNEDSFLESDFAYKDISFNDIFNSISDMVFIVDKELRIVHANSSFYSKSGYTDNNECCGILLSSKYIDIQSIINMCFIDGKNHNKEYQISFKNFSAWCLVSSSPIFNKYNEIHYVIISLVNIDKGMTHLMKIQNSIESYEKRIKEKIKELNELNNRLKTEMDEKNKICNSLHESETFLSIFWNFILAGVVIIDAETMKIVDINLQAQKMIGLDKSEIIGKICHCFICPAEKGNCPIIDKYGIVDNSERILVNKNGEQIPIIKTVAKIMINGKAHLIETFLDNTERNKAQDLVIFQEKNLQRIIDEKTNDLNDSILKLKDINIKLIEAEKNKNVFFKNISHELRTPLTGILGFAALLKEKHFGSLNQKQAEYVNQIEICGKHQVELINNLLEISKNESKFYNLVSKECKINDLILSVVAFFESQMSEKKQTFTIDLDNRIQILNIDIQKIRAVLSNIISNSVKYTNQNGKIHLKTELKKDLILISVEDNGIGISEEIKKKMFSNLNNDEDNKDNYSQGIGIGLFLTKCYIELHGGEIWVESLLGKGTKFTFSIPGDLIVN